MADDDPLRRLVHDLRNPLAIVDGFASLLARDVGGLSDEKREEYVQRIGSAAAEMRAILDAVPPAD